MRYGRLNEPFGVTTICTIAEVIDHNNTLIVKTMDGEIHCFHKDDLSEETLNRMTKNATLNLKIQSTLTEISVS